MKDHISASTHVEMPRETNSILVGDEVTYSELEELFQSDDNESDFEGFPSPDLETLFQSDDEESDFEGFYFPDLGALFTRDSDDEEFLGF